MIECAYCGRDVGGISRCVGCGAPVRRTVVGRAPVVRQTYDLRVAQLEALTRIKTAEISAQLAALTMAGVEREVEHELGDLRAPRPWDRRLTLDTFVQVVLLVVMIAAPVVLWAYNIEASIGALARMVK